MSMMPILVAWGTLPGTGPHGLLPGASVPGAQGGVPAAAVDGRAGGA